MVYLVENLQYSKCSYQKIKLNLRLQYPNGIGVI